MIDKSGENIPHIGFVSSDLKTERYWPQADIVQQFYRHGGQVHALQRSGVSLVSLGSTWANDPYVLRPQSVVVSSDKTLVACNPRGAAKGSPLRGSCYDVAGHWQVPIHWQRVQPHMCHGNLIAVDEVPGKVVAKKISLETGQVLATKSLSIANVDLCTIAFPLVGGTLTGVKD